MSRKAVLNITSTKKQDTMLASQNVPGTPLGHTVFTGDGMTLWMPTGRQLHNDNTGAFSFSESMRNRSTVFMKGLSETISVETSDSHPWLWRRICFTAKGILPDQAAGGINQSDYVRVVGLGGDPLRPTYYRSVTTFPDSSTQAQFMYSLIFRGQINIDWIDPIIAKVDRLNNKIVYDKTVKLNSGNDVGQLKRYTKYHPMNHNLRYEDDEQGNNSLGTFNSVSSKIGMGDYYVLDIFANNSAGEGVLRFAPEAKLYWHEK